MLKHVSCHSFVQLTCVLIIPFTLLIHIINLHLKGPRVKPPRWRCRFSFFRQVTLTLVYLCNNLSPLVPPHRDIVDVFRDWYSKCFLQLNTDKTKEMVVDFRRIRPNHRSISIQDDIQVVHTCKYLMVLMDDKLHWSNTDTLFRKGCVCMCLPVDTDVF